MAVQYSCCGSQFFIRIAICFILVVFAGLMSGLTLGLMSLSLVDLEVIAKAGSPADRKNASKILPVVQRQHLLLCTLLICNAAAMEALPIFLDSLVAAWGAILLSVTLILLFGEIIPQAVCSRYGLAIGAAVAPLVRVLVWICFPVAYPISKLLDLLLGKRHKALFRRAELKTLVDLHGNEVAAPHYFFLNEQKPSYSNGILPMQVKNLLSINPEDKVPVKNVTFRKIPRVSENMPLYDILNEFQKGHSHMAVVVRNSDSELSASKHPQEEPLREVRVEKDGKQLPQEKQLRSKRSLKKLKSLPKTTHEFQRETSKGKKWSKNVESEILDIKEKQLSELSGDGEAIGIITMEDVIEELLQEEIYDETDYRRENL